MDDTQSMTVRLPLHVHEHLRRKAFDDRVSMNELIVAAVAEKYGILAPRTDPAARSRRPRRPAMPDCAGELDEDGGQGGS